MSGGEWTGAGWMPTTVQAGAMRLPDQWTIRLHYARPPKGLSANDRTHWRAKANATAAIREEVMHLVRAAKIPACERIRVDLTWYVADRRRRDSDNLAPLAKAIYDGIGANRGVSARIVEDDDPISMQKPTPTIEYVKGCTAHFAIRITDLGRAL